MPMANYGNMNKPTPAQVGPGKYPLPSSPAAVSTPGKPPINDGTKPIYSRMPGNTNRFSVQENVQGNVPYQGNYNGNPGGVYNAGKPPAMMNNQPSGWSPGYNQRQIDPNIARWAEVNAPMPGFSAQQRPGQLYITAGGMNDDNRAELSAAYDRQMQELYRAMGGAPMPNTAPYPLSGSGPYSGSGQNAMFGRYRPPIMRDGPNNIWDDQGGYSYNLPNPYGPYQGFGQMNLNNINSLVDPRRFYQAPMPQFRTGGPTDYWNYGG